MKIPCYLISCKMLQQRLPNALHALSDLGLSVSIVSSWDGDCLSKLHSSHIVSPDLHRERTLSISSILLRNAGLPQPINSQPASSLMSSLPAWMNLRPISAGEHSVLLKHYYALSRIAEGCSPIGLIAEDDILPRSDTRSLFMNAVKEFVRENGDYLDLAGGCGLRPLVSSTNKCIQRVTPPSTRTNACYSVSKTCAKYLVEHFWPVCHPIDWHLLYLLNCMDDPLCFWSINEVFIHGSECGTYTSWRDA
jgi:GR25 family glycosyltransferase involved in LPS biosynthesis